MSQLIALLLSLLLLAAPARAQFTIPNVGDAANAAQAQVDKVDLEIIVAGIQGTGVISGGACSAQGSPDMTVAVATGLGRVGTTVFAIGSGNVTITTAHATNPRFDLVVVSDAGTKSVTAGTAAAAPVFPAIPASSIVLCAVYVPANDTAIASNQIVDKRLLVAHGYGGGLATAGSWPSVGSGTLLTTAEAGALERDANAWYLTTDAGNRGVVTVEHCIRQDSSRSLPNDTNENALFNSVTNGRLTLETGTYFFRGMIYVTGMSATSGNALIDVLGAGTAVAGTWLWQAWGIDNSTLTNAGTKTGTFTITQQSVASIATAGTGTGLATQIEGTVEITTAGTLIPSIDQVTASAATLAAGSYFCINRIGSTTLTSVGEFD